MNENTKRDWITIILWGLLAGGFISFIFAAILDALYDDPDSPLYQVQDTFLAIFAFCFLLTCPLVLISGYRGIRKRRFSSFLLQVAAVSLLGCILIYAPGFFESKTYLKLSKIRQEMRMIYIALSEYNYDNGKLPEKLSLLPDTGNYVDLYSHDGDSLDWIMIDDNQGYLISVGPDGVSNEGPDGTRLVYDPTNGLDSSGDLVRYVSCESTD